MMNTKKHSDTDTSQALTRPLVEGEEDAFLELVSAWPFTDGRRGEDFFARPIDHDPRFSMGDIIGVFVDEQLVSCCQIFPRRLRLAGEAVPVGGLGTVFTRPDQRGQGFAPRAIRSALALMQERKYELCLLHANRFAWYESMGFMRWGSARGPLRLIGDKELPDLHGYALEVERFDPLVHLEQVMALGDAYSADRHGCVVRDREAWTASLALAGNPVEEFVVIKDSFVESAEARDGDAQNGDPKDTEHVVAYLRGCVMGESWQILEWARAEAYAEHLAELIATTVRTVAQTVVGAPRLADPALEGALEARGLVQGASPEKQGEWMVQCIAPDRLAARFGLATDTPNEHSGYDVLNTLLPKAVFHFWTADRF